MSIRKFFLYLTIFAYHLIAFAFAFAISFFFMHTLVTSTPVIPAPPVPAPPSTINSLAVSIDGLDGSVGEEILQGYFGMFGPVSFILQFYHIHILMIQFFLSIFY